MIRLQNDAYSKDGMRLNAPMVNGVSDGCLVTGEGTSEKI